MRLNINSKPSTTIINKTGNWRTYRPKTDFNKCTGCGTCALVCPESIIIMQNIKNKKKPIADYSFCKGCGICALECPVKAIEMELENK